MDIVVRMMVLALASALIGLGVGPAPLAQAASVLTSDPPATETATTRLSGGDRYGTALAISRRAFADGADTVYLARGDVYVDALVAGSLTDGPVLLVRPCGALPPGISAEIDRLDPQQVIALGGKGAVCDTTLTQAAGGRPTDRLAGETRYDTAEAISQRAFPDGGEVSAVYLARGDDSPDAVAGGGLTDGPVLLLQPDGTAPRGTEWELARLLASTHIALGGEGAISDQAMANLWGEARIDRLSGQNRYATSAVIAGAAYGDTPANTVYLARGDLFADAVAAGSLSDGPVILVPGDCRSVPSTVARYLSLLRPDEVVALGGSGAVCDQTLRSAARSADALPPAVTVGVTTGIAHSCALAGDGSVSCWGDNRNGELGDGTTTTRLSPVQVTGLGPGSTVEIAAGGSHTCARTSHGALRCWGSDSYGQLGNLSTGEQTKPTTPLGFGVGTALGVATGQKHTCAVTVVDATRCWGSNAVGQIGTGEDPADPAGVEPWPVEVVGLGAGSTDVVSTGMLHTCALLSDASARCWGQNDSGALGTGTTQREVTPAQVLGLGPGSTRQLAPGGGHSCAITTAGAALCWGSGSEGQLGDGTRVRERLEPGPVTGLGRGSTATISARGSGSTCAVTTEGAALCWGSHGFGQLGIGSDHSPRVTPTPVKGLGSGVTDIDITVRHTCAAGPDEVWCWGNNRFGEVGDGTTTQRDAPVRVN